MSKQSSAAATASCPVVQQMLTRTILRYREQKAHPSDDQILVEFPLAITLNAIPIATLECTPGNEVALALGFCITEQFISSTERVQLQHHKSSPKEAEVALLIEGGKERIYQILQHKGVRVSSSCYGSGTHGIPARFPEVGNDFVLTPEQVHSLQKESEACQALFSNTGATHFCALYNKNLSLIAYSEDVGRHNALDKSIGQTMQSGHVDDIRLILLSSRVSHEMLRKSSAVKAQVIAGFSAVTSSAIHLAEQNNRTLLGFVRNGRMNIYSHSKRLGFSAPNPQVQTEPPTINYLL
ncbi:formate dehydrogenase accessory sulfurtransferase FdhD [Halodesulfovibrio aestuarii]|uniref:formate dehydrogenase accessory sulfurtransferase FdhD n=1 Tax=Halodesulfovibrio aestuarii TaxID=126333 RepID=UPI003D32E716